MKKTIIVLAVLLGLLVNAQSWSLTGNSGTNPGTNFIGTTDNQDLVFKTNNFERIKLNVSSNTNYFHGHNVFITDENPETFKIYSIVQGSTQFRIDGDYDFNVYLQENGGMVIIGSNSNPICSDCNDYKLFVKDGIRTEKIKVDIAASNGWADYVFHKNYELMPLKEVENFINRNGHLPEVPSTEEAIANGIELKEMNILLLKKVEELTLHAIEQQKRIEILEKKVK